MRQYFEIREQQPDALLLFQVGDFYELFFDDAKKVAAFLNITLTKRGKHNNEDIPLCGIPCHSLTHHLTKLIKGGFKVAICDQIEKARPGVLVTRKVTRLLTPGTLTDAAMLDDKNPSYICSFWPGTKDWGLVFVELLTFQAFATTISDGAIRMLESEIVRFLPDEILLESPQANKSFQSFFKDRGYPISFSLQTEGDKKNKWQPNLADETETDKALDLWQGKALDNWFDAQFTLEARQKLAQTPAIARSVGNLARYLAGHNRSALDQIQSINFYEPEDFLVIDPATQKNLEIISNIDSGTRKNSLFSVLDQAKTAMGSRTIKKWLQKPLADLDAITERHKLVSQISNNVSLMLRFADTLAQVSDLERIIGRIVLNRALPADYILLKESLSLLPELKNLIKECRSSLLAARLFDDLRELHELVCLLEQAINPELGAGKSPIKAGFDAELDRLRSLVENSEQEILALEAKEIKATGINSLKIRCNDLYGYSIEITKINLGLTPSHYILQQSLVGKSRYVTQELKALELEINNAREHIDEVEAKVFAAVKAQVLAKINDLRCIAQALANLDAIFAFAYIAYENKYVQPEFNTNRNILITAGRHPVVESSLNVQFIPNDTELQNNQSLWIITGPNMGGKSTYLRQVALICLMAQAGSLVPAKAASLPILDKIFTRIGSGDNLAAGKSTFLVEMEEVAAICRGATEHSLVILDEVGRGTSTFDGMAIAEAIVEFIYNSIGARCLFATHYHELTAMSKTHPNIANYMLKSQKTPNGIIFLHEIAKGVAGSSFGIEVAKLADLPKAIIARAKELMLQHANQPTKTPIMPEIQANFIAANCPEACKVIKSAAAKLDLMLKELKKTHPDDLSPRQAHDLIARIWSENKL